MVAMKQIEDIGREIGRVFHPDRVILFGSYAQGTPSEDSDVDLLVVMPSENEPVARSVEIRLTVRPQFPVDLLVRSRAAVDRRIAMGDDFMRDILAKGKVLYEADHP